MFNQQASLCMWLCSYQRNLGSEGSTHSEPFVAIPVPSSILSLVGIALLNDPIIADVAWAWTCCMLRMQRRVLRVEVKVRIAMVRSSLHGSS